MPLKVNPDTGEAIYLDDNNKWVPAPMKVNPDTKQAIAFDGKAWQPVDVHGHGISSVVDDAVKANASGMGAIVDWWKKTPSFAQQAVEQTKKDIEAYQRGGPKELMKDTKATQGLASGFGVGNIGEAVAAGPSRGALQIMRAMDRDKIAPQDIVPTAKPGVATLADVGGENVRGLLERVSQTPGAGRTVAVPFLTERQTQQASRIADDLSSLSGTKDSAFRATAETIKKRTDAAAPLYKAAYEAGDKPIWSDELERISATPEVQSAMHGAVTGWQRSQIAAGYGAMNPGAMVERGGMLKFLHGKVPVFPNLQFWDYTKAALDDMISKEITPQGTMTRRGRDLTIISKKLRGELDAQVPNYKTARDAWAGPSAYLTALEDGRNILSGKVSAEEMSANFHSLSASEQAAFKIGAISAIKGKMGSTPTELADMTRFLRSHEMRVKIATIMPTPEAAQKWLERLNFEVSSSKLVGQSLKNSATARRLAEQAEGQNIIGDLVLNAMTAGATKGLLHSNLFENSLIRHIIMAPAKAIRNKLRAKADEDVVNLLTNPDIPGVVQSLQRPRTKTKLLRRGLGESVLQRSAYPSDQDRQQ